jgi:hypothetical protein
MKANYFYKYHTINQNLYSSIINNELYFSSPRNFNDPFDSYPRFTLTENIEKLELFYFFLKSKVSEFESIVNSSKLNQKKLEDFKNVFFTFNELNLFDEELYSNEIDNNNDKLIELYAFYSDYKNFENLLIKNITFLQVKMYYDYIFITIDNRNFGISCGSLNPKCPLMWGHYGNNHQGVCVKYEFEDNNISLGKDIFVDILEVNYSNKPINIFDYSHNELDSLKFAILTNKYSKWKYENEVRLINQGQGLLKINKKIIKEVIFGCKSIPKDRYSIIKLFASLGYNIDKLQIAKRLPNQYELSIEEMKINDLVGSGVFIEELNLNKNVGNLF